MSQIYIMFKGANSDAYGRYEFVHINYQLGFYELLTSASID